MYDIIPHIHIQANPGSVKHIARSHLSAYEMAEVLEKVKDAMLVGSKCFEFYTDWAEKYDKVKYAWLGGEVWQGKHVRLGGEVWQGKVYMTGRRGMHGWAEKYKVDHLPGISGLL